MQGLVDEINEKIRLAASSKGTHEAGWHEGCMDFSGALFVYGLFLLFHHTSPDQATNDADDEDAYENPQTKQEGEDGQEAAEHSEPGASSGGDQVVIDLEAEAVEQEPHEAEENPARVEHPKLPRSL